MKQYVVDQLRPEDYNKIKSYLDEKLGVSGISGLYKLLIPQDYLSEIQVEHVRCQPHYFAIDLEPDRMACELLVRTDNQIRCDCMGYATDTQRNWLVHFTDAMLVRLKVSV